MTQLLRLISSHPDREASALAHLFLGQAHERAGRDQAALTAYRIALIDDPALQPAQLAVARSLQRSQDVEAATAVIVASVDAAPQEVHTWFGYHTSMLRSYRSSMESLLSEVRP